MMLNTRMHSLMGGMRRVAVPSPPPPDPAARARRACGAQHAVAGALFQPLCTGCTAATRRPAPRPHPLQRPLGLPARGRGAALPEPGLLQLSWLCRLGPLLHAARGGDHPAHGRQPEQLTDPSRCMSVCVVWGGMWQGGARGALGEWQCATTPAARRTRRLPLCSSWAGPRRMWAGWE
jgi:hypothetical protein